MIIEVQKIPEEGGAYTGTEPPELLEPGVDSPVQAAGAIRYDFFVQRAGAEVLVQGRLSLPLTSECSRCGVFFSTTIENLPFNRSFELEAGAETVDVTPEMRDELLLQLPHYPLCVARCRGLCPQCGTNLNGKRCRCKPRTGGTDWSALNGLKAQP